jgi:hypothetical protein
MVVDRCSKPGCSSSAGTATAMRLSSRSPSSRCCRPGRSSRAGSTSHATSAAWSRSSRARPRCGSRAAGGSTKPGRSATSPPRLAARPHAPVSDSGVLYRRGRAPSCGGRPAPHSLRHGACERCDRGPRQAAAQRLPMGQGDRRLSPGQWREEPVSEAARPWGPRDDLQCANRAGLQDGWTGPVASFACGARPLRYHQLGRQRRRVDLARRSGRRERVAVGHARRLGQFTDPPRSPCDDLRNHSELVRNGVRGRI